MAARCSTVEFGFVMLVLMLTFAVLILGFFLSLCFVSRADFTSLDCEFFADITCCGQLAALLIQLVSQWVGRNGRL